MGKPANNLGGAKVEMAGAAEPAAAAAAAPVVKPVAGAAEPAKMTPEQVAAAKAAEVAARKAHNDAVRGKADKINAQIEEERGRIAAAHAAIAELHNDRRALGDTLVPEVALGGFEAPEAAEESPEG